MSARVLLLTKENHYQEVFLPFASDHTFPPDTVFFVVEPDFAFKWKTKVPGSLGTKRSSKKA